MAEYKSNSHKSKANEEKKKIEKVVTGKVIVKNRSLGQKISDTFLSEDISNVKNYAVHELIIPGLKDMFLDCMSMLLNGTTRRSNSSRTGSSFSYGSYFTAGSSTKKSPAKTYSLTNDGYNYKTIILDNKGDAEYILDTLLAEIDQYGKAFVSDLYQMVDISGTYIDTQYGWENLSTAKVKRVPEGYLLDLPKAIKLE